MSTPSAASVAPTSSFTFDKLSPRIIHLQNLHAMMTIHAVFEEKNGSDSPAALYHACTKRFYDFYSTTTLTPEFIDEYEVLRDGIRGKITNVDVDSPLGRARAPRATPHGVPHVVDFVFHDPMLHAVVPRDNWCEVIQLGQNPTPDTEMGSWVMMLASRTRVPSDKYRAMTSVGMREDTSFYIDCRRTSHDVARAYAAYSAEAMRTKVMFTPITSQFQVECVSCGLPLAIVPGGLTVDRHFAWVTAKTRLNNDVS